MVVALETAVAVDCHTNVVCNLLLPRQANNGTAGPADTVADVERADNRGIASISQEQHSVRDGRDTGEVVRLGQVERAGTGLGQSLVAGDGAAHGEITQDAEVFNRERLRSAGELDASADVGTQTALRLEQDVGEGGHKPVSGGEDAAAVEGYETIGGQHAPAADRDAAAVDRQRADVILPPVHIESTVRANEHTGQIADGMMAIEAYLAFKTRYAGTRPDLQGAPDGEIVRSGGGQCERALDDACLARKRIAGPSQGERSSAAFHETTGPEDLTFER